MTTAQRKGPANGGPLALSDLRKGYCRYREQGRVARCGSVLLPVGRFLERTDAAGTESKGGSVLLPVGRFLERTDAIIQRRVAGEQALHQRAGLALGDGHGAQGVGHLVG